MRNRKGEAMNNTNIFRALWLCFVTFNAAFWGNPMLLWLAAFVLMIKEKPIPPEVEQSLRFIAARLEGIFHAIK
jgi:hypothetical protein